MRAACCLTLPQSQVCPAAPVIKGRRHTGRETGPRHVLKPRQALSRQLTPRRPFSSFQLPIPPPTPQTQVPQAQLPKDSKLDPVPCKELGGHLAQYSVKIATHGQSAHRQQVPGETGGTMGQRDPGPPLVLPFTGKHEKDLGVMA